VHILTFVRRARDAGFPSAAIKSLLSLCRIRFARPAKCAGSRRTNCGSFEARMAELRASRARWHT